MEASVGGPAFEVIEQWIRSGRIRDAASALRAKLAKRDLRFRGPEERVRAASLCRRADVPELGVLLLHRIVRPGPRSVARASEPELVEYGALLVRMGAVTEGLSVLERIVSARFPQATLYRAFGEINRWDYAAAIPLLQIYCGSSGLSPYERLIAQTNLAASLVAEEQLNEAEKILDGADRESVLQNRRLIQGNLLEIRAQLEIRRRRWNPALDALRNASELFEGENTRSTLYVEKWKSVVALLRDGATDETCAHLASVRARALSMSEWETVRDCDFQLARGTEDPEKRLELALRVFFGTPHLAYRRKVTEFIYEKGQTVPATWTRLLSEDVSGPGLKGQAPLLDLQIGTQKHALKAGQVVQRTLWALSCDAYRPTRLAALHDRVFPGRHYHPTHSPAVMHQALKRLRQWLNSARLPVQIREHTAFYHLGARGPCFLRLRAEPGNTRKSLVARVLLEQGKKEISISEAERLFEVSYCTAYRMLREALDSGLLKKIGSGPRSRYRVNY